MVGTLNIFYMINLDLKLPELNHNAEFYAKHHLTDKLLNYDLILGRDILHGLGIVFNFENKTVTWQKINSNETTKLYCKGILCNQRKSPSQTRNLKNQTNFGSRI